MNLSRIFHLPAIRTFCALILSFHRAIATALMLKKAFIRTQKAYIPVPSNNSKQDQYRVYGFHP